MDDNVGLVDTDGYQPLRQYTDLRGHVFLRSADRKWLGWAAPHKAWNSDEIRPGNWYLCGVQPLHGFGWERPQEGHDPTLPVMPVQLLARDQEVSPFTTEPSDGA